MTTETERNRSEVPLGDISGSRAIDSLHDLAKRENDLRDREKRQENVDKEKELLKLEEEVFFYEHDPSGALVGERWGVDMAGKFSEVGERPVETDQDGQIKPSESDDKDHFIVIGMGELDRINDEVGHAGADKVLAQTYEKAVGQSAGVLEDKNLNGGLKGDLEGYRRGGNQFVINLKNAPESAAKAIVDRLNKQERGAIVPDELKGQVKEAPPLYVNRLSMKEAVSTLNEIQGELQRQDLGTIPEGKQLEGALIDVVATMAEMNSEVDKYVNRCQRVMEKITRRELDKDGREKEGPVKEDTDLDKTFEQYLKKGMTGEFQTLDGFRSFVDKGTGQIKPEFAAKVQEAAMKSAADWLVNEKSKGDARSAVMAGVMAKRRELQVGDLTAKPPESAAETAARKTAAKDRPPLSGVERMKAMSAQVEDLRKKDPEGYETKKAVLELQAEKAKRDSLTGLEKRRAYYLQLAEMLQPDAEGKLPDVSVVAVDMAFLKFFDREAGAQVGNEAIKESSRGFEQLQQAMTKAGIEIKPFRTGGDEFNILIKGGAEAAKKADQALKEVAEKLPLIGIEGKAKGSYVDSKLTYNTGLADTKMLLQVEQDLRAKGLVPKEVDRDPRHLAKWRAELLNEMADSQISEQKAENRFADLYRKLTDEETWKKELRDRGYSQEQVDQAVDKLVTYSEKAIFGNGAEVKKWAKENWPPSKVLERVRELVENKQESKLQEKREKKLVYEMTVERSVMEVRYQREVSDLEGKLKQAEEDYGNKSAQVVELQNRMMQTEERFKKQVQSFLDKAA
jgi:GGDEF domain-containing protein